MSAPTNPQAVELRFFDLANQYYAAGRFSVISQLAPVGANLLHHAVEMYLKGVLSRRITLGKLQKNFGHHLNKIWREFKSMFPTASLSTHDPVILELDRFEALRYPNTMGLVVQFALNRGELVGAKVNAPNSSQHQLCLEDVDELVKAIFSTACVNPSAFFWSEQAKKIILDRSKHPLI